MLLWKIGRGGRWPNGFLVDVAQINSNLAREEEGAQMDFTVVIFKRGPWGNAATYESVNVSDREVAWWRVSI